MRNYLQFKTLGSAFLLVFLFAFIPKTTFAFCDFDKGVVTASVNAICAGESVTLTHSGFEYAADFQWQHREDLAGAWIDIPGATASTYVATPIVTTQYRMGMINNDDFCDDWLDPYFTNPITISVNTGGGNNAGEGSEVEVCISEEEVDLSELFTGGDTGGTYSYPDDESLINGATFNISNLNSGTHTVFYSVEGSCGSDTAESIITIIGNANPGENTTHAACSAEGTIELDGLFPGSDANGTFSYPSDESLINNSTFDISNLTAGTYTVYHIVSTDCSEDQAEVVITVSSSANAGADAALTVCKNEPFNLNGLLDQNADFGGVWTEGNNILEESVIVAGNTGGVFTYTYTVGSDGCPDAVATFTITVDEECDYLGVNDEIFAHISIYPNPTTNSVNLTNLDKEFNAEIVDLNGRVVLTKTLNANNSTISLEKFESGIYALRIFNNEGQKVVKIIKK